MTESDQPQRAESADSMLKDLAADLRELRGGSRTASTEPPGFYQAPGSDQVIEGLEKAAESIARELSGQPAMFPAVVDIAMTLLYAGHRKQAMYWIARGAAEMGATGADPALSPATTIEGIKKRDDYGFQFCGYLYDQINQLHESLDLHGLKPKDLKAFLSELLEEIEDRIRKTYAMPEAVTASGDLVRSPICVTLERALEDFGGHQHYAEQVNMATSAILATAIRGSQDATRRAQRSPHKAQWPPAPAPKNPPVWQIALLALKARGGSRGGSQR